MQFSYQAMTMDGQSRTGILAAGSPVELRRSLREQGMQLLQATPLKEATAARTVRSRSRISKTDLLHVTSQFAIMSQAGVDLASALNLLAMENAHPHLRQVLTAVHERVSAGESIAEALRSQGKVFGEAYIASVAAGEASGKLPNVLTRLTQLLRSDIQLASTIRSILAYPIVLLVVSMSVMVALVFFVLPTFADVFDRMGVPLPGITQFMIDTSAWLKAHGLILAAAAVGMTFGGVALLRTPAGRLWFDQTILRLPLFRVITRNMAVGRSFRLLGTMVDSGVPLLEALGLVEEASTNTVYRRLFHEIRQDVVNGRPMSGAMARSQDIPPAAASMIATGERTGNLGSVLQLLGEHYENEAETKFKDLATLLEPALVIFVGAIVAVVVLSLVIPMFDFTAAADSR